jgi:hypothetical protein
MDYIALKELELPKGKFEFIANSTMVCGMREECIAALTVTHLFAQDIGASVRTDSYVDHDGITQVVEIPIYTMKGGYFA